MKIQLATYNGKNNYYINDSRFDQYSIHNIKSIDEYDITVILLDDNELWRNTGASCQSIDAIKDFSSISHMLYNSASKVMIILPRNYVFKYHSNGQKFLQSVDLKDIIPELWRILGIMYSPSCAGGLLYENTTTVINECSYEAAFYFTGVSASDAILNSKSGKKVMVKDHNIYLTTLHVRGGNELMNILYGAGLIEVNESIPKWIEQYPMFDDLEQYSVISSCNDQINRLNASIEAANEIISSNSKIKSILYTTGEKLVDVVFEILEEVLGCDLSDFIDEKKEDFLFNIGDTVFIGEIKGVNRNVQNKDVSQLDNHYQSYLDDHEMEDADNIKALLIMNYENTREPLQRDSITENQIKLAKRNGSLIIDTFTLLKLLEKYRNGTLSRQDIFLMLKNTTGVLEV